MPFDFKLTPVTPCTDCGSGQLELSFGPGNKPTNPDKKIYWSDINGIPSCIANCDTLKQFILATILELGEVDIQNFIIGNGVDTSITLVNPFNTESLLVQVQERIGGELVYPTVRISPTQIIIIFAAPPALNEYRVVVSV